MAKAICGITSNCGPNDEPLACGFAEAHEGNHSWSSLPTFSKGESTATASGAEGDGDVRPSRHFLTRLIELLRDAIDPDKLKAAIKSARAYAGGKTSPKKQMKANYYQPYYDDETTGAGGDDMGEPKFEKADKRVNYRTAKDIGQTCGDCTFYSGGCCSIVEGAIDENYTCNLIMGAGKTATDPLTATDIADICATNASPRLHLFVELSKEFAEAPDHIPFMPMPGSYTHPTYGKIKLTRERLARFVQNFNSGIYQKRIPIDAEHQTKLSGAFGWLDQLRQNADGSVDAHVEEWTDRGKQALAENRFKYVSPEWYETWQEPMTERFHSDIAIGVALCTRPFFKEGGLRPLIASERGFEEFDPQQANEGAEKMPDPAKTQSTEPTLESRLAAETDARKALETHLAAAETTNKKLTEDAQRKRFTDIVKGRSDENTVRWAGEDANTHVDFLMSLSNAFGEDSKEVKGYIARENASAKRLMDSGLFKEHGSENGGNASDATTQLSELAATRAKEKSISLTEAMSQVAAENPQLYAEHQDASYAKKG
ncbi:MAG: phage protease [Blastocatellia bacterium]